MLVTVVTVCYKAKDDLENTINSVLEQDYDNLEFIVIDGDSKDGTIEMLSGYKKRLEKKNIDHLFISEPDDGIYDAMNKGVKYAKGEWIIFLNAGDLFFQRNSLSTLAQSCNKQCDIVYGDAIHSYENKINKVYATKKEKLSFQNGMEFCHQSTLIRTSLLKKRGYDLSYKIAGDYDFFVYAFSNSYIFKYVESSISVFQRDGISSTNAGIVTLENTRVKYKYKLISKSVYLKTICKSKLIIFLRSIVPNKIVERRHKKIMDKETKNWNHLREE